MSNEEMKESPSADQVKALRKEVQDRLGLKITECQAYCARKIWSGTRTWQQWEQGKCKMHPGLYELAMLKLVNNVYKIADYAMWHTEPNKNLGGWVTEIICEDTGKILCRVHDECQDKSRILAGEIAGFMSRSVGISKGSA